jgi:hypothetical protein
MALLAGLVRKPYGVVVLSLSEVLAVSSRFHEGILVAFCAVGGSTMSSVGSDAGSPKDRSLCVASLGIGSSIVVSIRDSRSSPTGRSMVLGSSSCCEDHSSFELSPSTRRCEWFANHSRGSSELYRILRSCLHSRGLS